MSLADAGSKCASNVPTEKVTDSYSMAIVSREGSATPSTLLATSGGAIGIRGTPRDVRDRSKDSVRNAIVFGGGASVSGSHSRNVTRRSFVWFCDPTMSVRRLQDAAVIPAGRGCVIPWSAGNE